MSASGTSATRTPAGGGADTADGAADEASDGADRGQTPSMGGDGRELRGDVFGRGEGHQAAQPTAEAGFGLRGFVGHGGNSVSRFVREDRNVPRGTLRFGGGRNVIRTVGRCNLVGPVRRAPRRRRLNDHTFKISLCFTNDEFIRGAVGFLLDWVSRIGGSAINARSSRGGAMEVNEAVDIIPRPYALHPVASVERAASPGTGRRPGGGQPLDAQLRPAAPGHAHDAAPGARARRRARSSGCVPHIGYLHSGFEKLGEHLNYNQYVTIVDRMDYSAPIYNELAWHGAAEKLMGDRADAALQGAAHDRRRAGADPVAPAVRRRGGPGPGRVHRVPLRLQRAREDLRHRRVHVRPAVPHELDARRRVEHGPARRGRRSSGW